MSQAGALNSTGGGGGGGLNTLTGNSGVATQSSSNINVIGAGGITTSGSGSTLTITGGGSIITIDGDTGSASGDTVTFTGGTSGAKFTGNGVSDVTLSFPSLTVATDFNVSSSSIMTNTKQPAFSYYASMVQGLTTATPHTIVFDVKVFDNASNFDGVSTFTAPVTGLYWFNAQIQMAGAGATDIILLTIQSAASTATINVVNGSVGDAFGNLHMNGSVVLPLSATNTVTCVIENFSSNSSSVALSTLSDFQTAFQGYLIA